MRFAAVILSLTCFVMPLWAQTPDAPLTNADVISLLSAKISPDIVVTQIQRATEVAFDLSTDGLVSLKQQNVPDAVLEAMMAREDAKADRPSKGRRVGRVAGRVWTALTPEFGDDEDEGGEDHESPAALPPSGTREWTRKCKPDVSNEDKISKVQNDIWFQSLFATGFAASMMKAQEVGITVSVGRYGNLNAVNLQVTKSDESAERLAFESTYQAAVGKPFYLGFNNAEPITFTVTEVGNNAQIQQGLFAAKGVTSVVLSATLSDHQMGTLRETLTTRRIDAVRIILAGDVRIEKSVGEDNGNRMMEKFSCFYQTLDLRGVDLHSKTALATNVTNVKPAASAPAASGDTTEDRLRKLDDFLKKGLITKSEYDKKRAEILKDL